MYCRRVRVRICLVFMFAQVRPCFFLFAGVWALVFCCCVCVCLLLVVWLLRVCVCVVVACWLFVCVCLFVAVAFSLLLPVLVCCFFGVVLFC